MKTARSLWVASLLVFVLSGSAVADVLTKLDRLDSYEIKVGGFELTSDGEVAIEAVGGRQMENNAWIIRSDNREVVWEMLDANRDRRSKYLVDYDDKINLESGRYEVYYSSFPYHDGDDHRWINDWNWGWGDDDDDRSDRRRFERSADEFMIQVSGTGRSLDERDIVAGIKEIQGNALLSLTELDDEVFEKYGLELSQDLELEIYAVGELRKHEQYDATWIVDNKTGKRVWELEYWDSEPAGGASKNRMFKGKVKIDAGSYTIWTVTDDSHDFRKWNSAPPFDPHFWGVTIQVADPARAKYAKITDAPDSGIKNAFVELIRLRDDTFEQRGFTLKKRSKVRVYAIGEGKGRDMYDYSRIVDADTRDVVWEFDGRDAQHAGGASKNRMIDETIELAAGDYIVYALTDGSHSYRRWNAAAPYDQERWGITLSLPDGNMNDVTEYVEKDSKDVLVRLVGIGDYARERESFKLDNETTVRVYAIGEGTGGHMYDFAWIEDEDGKIVWEMTYRRTDHAGGARKNRVYNDTIKLAPGEYTVYYESDGSHSFKGWNASPPTDVINWGVTVKIAQGK